MIKAVNGKVAGWSFALLVLIIVLCWAFYQWGMQHVIYNSDISDDGHFYKLSIDGEVYNYNMGWGIGVRGVQEGK